MIQHQPGHDDCAAADAIDAELERLRIEAMKPDTEKIHRFGREILLELDFPTVASKKAIEFLSQIDRAIIDLAHCCEAFKP